MNTAPTSDERQRLIAAAADSYTAPPPQSHAVLMPIRESLATLRTKGASYRTIVRMLRNVDIQVSLDTLARFCREHIEQTPSRKDKRRSIVRRLNNQPEGALPPARPESAEPESSVPAKPPKESDTPPPTRGKGPRIADVSSI